MSLPTDAPFAPRSFVYEDTYKFPYSFIQSAAAITVAVLLLVPRTRTVVRIAVEQYQLLVLLVFLGLRLPAAATCMLFMGQFTHFKVGGFVLYLPKGQTYFGYYSQVGYNALFIYCTLTFLLMMLTATVCCMKNLLNQVQRIVWTFIWLMFLPLTLYIMLMFKSIDRQSAAGIIVGFATLLVYGVFFVVLSFNFCKNRSKRDVSMEGVEPSSLLELRRGIGFDSGKLKHYYNLLWVPMIKFCFVGWAVFYSKAKAEVNTAVVGTLSIIYLGMTIFIRPYKLLAHNLYLIFVLFFNLAVINLSVFNIMSPKLYETSGPISIVLIALFLIGTLSIAFFFPVQSEEADPRSITTLNGTPINTDVDSARMPLAGGKRIQPSPIKASRQQAVTPGSELQATRPNLNRQGQAAQRLNQVGGSALAISSLPRKVAQPNPARSPALQMSQARNARVQPPSRAQPVLNRPLPRASPALLKPQGAPQNSANKPAIIARQFPQAAITNNRAVNR